MLKVEVDSYEDIVSFMRDSKEDFFVAIINAIKLGWKEKITPVPVAEFLINDSGEIFTIDIMEEDWSESLGYALSHYEEVEDYERCSELKTMIDEMYS